MNRNYDVDKVASTYASFRASTETIFYCNWMVGFPGETEEDFQKTVELVKALDLQINVAIPFSARPGTPAENLSDQISEEVKTRRVTHLTKIIADMKVEAFRKELHFLVDVRLKPLLENIGKAELQQYHEPQSHEKPVFFQKITRTSLSKVAAQE
jgi:tRNA-2-methylthio-N6-dimethylallyladenosine synthase